MKKFEEFYLSLKEFGINFATGVPCAAIKKLLFSFINDPELPYIQAAREEDAIGIATGAHFAGKNPIVLMQNSGLANSINALTSLCIPYKIPILILVTWRGFPDDKNEPIYHHTMGRATIPIMAAIDIPVEIVSGESPEEAIYRAMKNIKERQIPSIMLLRRKGVLE